MGDRGATEKNVDQLQYQMMVSSQTMPYDVEQVEALLLFRCCYLVSLFLLACFVVYLRKKAVCF